MTHSKTEPQLDIENKLLTQITAYHLESAEVIFEARPDIDALVGQLPEWALKNLVATISRENKIELSCQVNENCEIIFTLAESFWICQIITSDDTGWKTVESFNFQCRSPLPEAFWKFSNEVTWPDLAKFFWQSQTTTPSHEVANYLRIKKTK